jgi:hypothetical protein
MVVRWVCVWSAVTMSVSEGQVFDPVLLNTFLIRKKRCRVYFHRGTLIWESEGASYCKYMIFFTEHVWLLQLLYCHTYASFSLVHLSANVLWALTQCITGPQIYENKSSKATIYVIVGLPVRFLQRLTTIRRAAECLKSSAKGQYFTVAFVVVYLLVNLFNNLYIFL